MSATLTTSSTLMLLPFLNGSRHMDSNNWGPRVGFNWANPTANFSVHGGYGIYYDRITLEIQSLERGLDGRALPIDVYAGNVNITRSDRTLRARRSDDFPNPFTGFIIPGAGGAQASTSSTTTCRTRWCSSSTSASNTSSLRTGSLRADGIHNLGTHFIIGVPVGSVFNPDSGGPETVTTCSPASTRTTTRSGSPSTKRSPADISSMPPTRSPRPSTTPITIRFPSAIRRSIPPISVANTDRRPTISAIASSSRRL